jgi:hypothetical protein
MPASGSVVGVVGMAALRRDINRLVDDQKSPLYAAIKQAGKSAVEPVAGAVRGTVPHDSGTLSGSVRTSGTRTGGSVRMGRASVPYAGWIDFGGGRPDGSSREFVADGRYLFPAARGLASVAADRYAAALDQVFASDGVWTNVTSDGSAVHD